MLKILWDKTKMLIIPDIWVIKIIENNRKLKMKENNKAFTNSMSSRNEWNGLRNNESEKKNEFFQIINIQYVIHNNLSVY